MHQYVLHHEDILDALATDIMAAGGFKKVAAAIWPNMRMESAYARLKACMDADKDQKLSPEEVMSIKRMAREVDSWAAVTFELRELHFEAPAPVEPEDQRARVQQEFVDAVAHLERLKRELESWR
jgi:hypothetical protein